MKLLRLLPVLLILHAVTVAQDAPAPTSYSYLLLYNGANIGWLTSTFTRAQLNDADVLLEQQQIYMRIQRSFDDQAFETKSTTSTWYAPGYSEVRRHDVTVSGAQKVELDIRWGDEIRISQTVDGGNARQVTLTPGEAPVLGTLAAWQRLRESKPGTKLDFQMLDEINLALVPETWTVSGSVKRNVGDSIIEGTEVAIVSNGRASTAIFNKHDLPEYYQHTGGFALLRVESIPQPFKPEPVTLRSVMRANVAVPDELRLESMEIEFKFKHDDGDGIPPLADNNAYHDVRKLNDGYQLTLKSARMAESAAAMPYPLKEISDDAKPFLAPTAMCQSDDEDLARVAKTLANGKDNAAQVTRAIIRYVERRLSGGSGDTGAASAKQAWLEKQGDCTEHAALFVALARAAGLPARNAGGLTYLTMGEDGGMFGFHAWAEVWLGEWVPVDTTVGELGTSARYILSEYDEPGSTHGRGRASRMLEQEISPKITAYKLETGKSWKR